MPDELRTPTLLADYRAPDFLVDTVDLVFDLRSDGTTVSSRLTLRRNPAASDPGAPLVLDGQDMALVSVALDGEALGANRYTVEPERLVLPDMPDAFTLDVVTEIHPESNTALEGLYVSGGNFVTQCEAQGFRRITYYPDRPDVLARFTTTLSADRATHPVLLSNGNRVDGGEAPGGRHWAKWQDPFPKPAYLFALVAGDLQPVSDSFVTRSGRRVELNIWVRPPDLDKCDHAMRSLKASMAWDERAYGFEYDLDLFNIVAVSDFNMGAMENKGLNIFNTALVLAKPETATDADYQRVEGVVAHEYFHNWTGNRITCRDWFQLSLKEGLTVFRDQEFSADMNSRPVKRIQDVRRLRASQFPEDAGPLAHPVRPESYIEINNFYTPTVYEKGSEVVRMIATLIGPERYRAGIDLYVKRHDGGAVTIEDFVAAMEDASGADLTQFRRWYAQAGTPELTVTDGWDEGSGTYSLTVRQHTPPTPGQPVKPPLHIPLAVGLLDPDGTPLPVAPEDSPEGAAGAAAGAAAETAVLNVTEPEQTFRFPGLARRPVPSLLRGFSAPVRLAGQDLARLQFLFAADRDPFARWEAGQQLATRLLLDGVATWRAHPPGAAVLTPLDDAFVAAWGATLADAALEPAFRAEALRLPGHDFLADQMPTVDPEGIHAARTAALAQLAAAHHDALLAAYEASRDDGPYAITAEAMGRRALKNLCLGVLARAPDGAAALVARQFETAGNMTDSLAALEILSHAVGSHRDAAFAAFYDRWRDEALVVDKWFALQALSERMDTPEVVRALLDHPAFTLKVPNRARSLIGSFALGNPLRFQAADGSGYRFLADQVLALDPLNPQTAARLLLPLGRWRRQEAGRQRLMRAELERILAAPDLSKDVFEIASKSAA